MTENTTRQTDRTNRAMKDVDHTHPDTGRPFGEQVVFARGPAVAADGGKRRAEEKPTDETEDEEASQERMKDIDHEPPNEAEANRVFERGREGRDDDR